MWLLSILSVIFSLLPTVRSEHPVCLKTQPNITGSSVSALVLARGGSKAIPLKNLAKINGKPLLIRTLGILKDSGQFDSIWVSTDDERIASAVEIAFSANQILVHFRAPELAQDHTSSIESTVEFLDKHTEIQNVALVQCTSPFLRLHYLKEALRRFLHSSPVDCVFSVVRSFKLRWQQVPTDGRVVPLNFDPDNRPRRQDWSGELVEAGMFYFARRKLLLAGRFQNDACGVVEIDGRDSLEIDTGIDLDLARIIVEAEDNETSLQ